jgi:hypothetical protein
MLSIYSRVQVHLLPQSIKFSQEIFSSSVEEEVVERILLKVQIRRGPLAAVAAGTFGI